MNSLNDQGQKMGRMSRDEYMEELERAAEDMGLEGHEKPVKMSEAERLAHAADATAVKSRWKANG